MTKRALLIFISLILVLLFVKRNAIEEWRIKSLRHDLYMINDVVLQTARDPFEPRNAVFESLVNNSDSKISNYIATLINQYELCHISGGVNTGISYKFKCKNDSWNDYLFSDESYYLLKILNHENAENFLHYPQFYEYRSKLIKLDDDWYFIRIDYWRD